MVGKVRHAFLSKDFCAFENFLGVASASLYRLQKLWLKGGHLFGGLPDYKLAIGWAIGDVRMERSGSAVKRRCKHAWCADGGLAKE
jgi:hypothetical protein